MPDVERALRAAGLPFRRFEGALAPEADTVAAVVVGSADAVAPLVATGERVGVAVGDSSLPRTWAPGLEYFVRRPLDPAALRLLISHLLSGGGERRLAPRRPLDLPVRLRVGLRRHRAHLVELSATGARIRSPLSLAPGRRVGLRLPGGADGAPALSLRARVLRCSLGEGGADEIALAFTALPLASQAGLRRLLTGPASSPSERRRDERHPYGRHVIARGPAVPRVLLGRDLSMGGMRVERADGLDLGVELQVALHVRRGDVPLVVRARVERDDGPAGLFLRFVSLGDKQRSYLAGMVFDLPGLASQDGGLVVSQVLQPGFERAGGSAHEPEAGLRDADPAA